MSDGSGLSAAELAQIQARYDQASPGPWTSIVEGRDQVSGSSFIMTGGEDIDPLRMRPDDQDFAAHARQDVPRLVDEVRRLSRGGEARVAARELAEIANRCERASASPWHTAPPNRTHAGPATRVTTGTGGNDFELRGVNEDDPAFIAHARQDVPRLLAEVRRLRRELGLDEDATG
jgi:hypothetical protein